MYYTGLKIAWACLKNHPVYLSIQSILDVGRVHVHPPLQFVIVVVTYIKNIFFYFQKKHTIISFDTKIQVNRISEIKTDRFCNK